LNVVGEEHTITAMGKTTRAKRMGLMEAKSKNTMIKKKIRCYKVFANVFLGIYNYTVYCMLREGWSNLSLSTYINCGELFVINWENPKTHKKTINEIAGISCCPTCGFLLNDTLREYPKTIKLSNGKLGSFVPNNFIPPDCETEILDFFEIIPEK
jgi:hypothetical protein